MAIVKPTFEDFKSASVMGVVKNIVNWIIDTLVPTYNTDIASKANSSDLSAVAKTGSYTDLTNKPSLATVATTGSYNDLINKPNIPSEITVDTTLSTTSTNPIANKTIYTYVGTDSDLIE